MKVPILFYIQLPQSILDSKTGCLRDHMIFIAIIRSTLEQQAKFVLFSGKKNNKLNFGYHDFPQPPTGY